MRKQLYFRTANAHHTIKEMASISKTPLIGDIDFDTAVYGIIQEQTSVQLLWGSGTQEHDPWLLIEWEDELPPSAFVFQLVFSILDHPLIDAKLQTNDSQTQKASLF